MTRLLIVDDSDLALRYLPGAVTDELGWHVASATRPDELPDMLGPLPQEGGTREAAAGESFDLAVVDLSFVNSSLSGLDALLAVHGRMPGCRLVVYTQGDPSVAEMLRDAWDAFRLACALSKSTPMPMVLRSLQQVATHGTAPVDPVLQPLLPANRSPWRSLDGYGRLVGHAGHAKLWQALIELDAEPSYKDLADHTGLSLAAVRNYRSELLDHLALHYLDRPKMRQMQLFAKRCRPLLAPHIRRKLHTER